MRTRAVMRGSDSNTDYASAAVVDRLGRRPTDFRVATEAVYLVLGAATKVDKALMGIWSVDTILWQAAGSLQALDSINGGGSV